MVQNLENIAFILLIVPKTPSEGAYYTFEWMNEFCVGGSSI